jgi:hypothetical protein
MITRRIVKSFMITAMMIISTSVAEAQRINREALQKLSQGGEPSPAATAQAPMSERNLEMDPAAEGEESSQGVLLEISAKKAKAIVGSWLDTVTVAGGQTFKSLSTYAEDGGVVFNDQGTVITEPPFPHVFSAGHGVWVHLGGRTFSQTAFQLISDLKGDLLFVNRLRQTLTLNESGDGYRVVWKAAFTDPSGNLITSFQGTTEGLRIKAEPLP